MITRAGFIRGVLGLAFTASVAMRGAAQEWQLEVPRPEPAVSDPEDFFTTQARYMAMAMDQLAGILAEHTDWTTVPMRNTLSDRTGGTLDGAFRFITGGNV